MEFNQNAYLREMQTFSTDAYFSCYAKNNVGKPLDAENNNNLINKAKESKSHGKP